MKQHVYIAADHGGIKLRSLIAKHLEEQGWKVVEFNDKDEVKDYPHYAKLVTQQVLHNGGLGILVCGTGIGMSIAANKVKGIRAAVVGDVYSARMTREHNDSNVLCLGERVLGSGLALEIVDTWVRSEFVGGRHARRLQQIKEMESC